MVLMNLLEGQKQRIRCRDQNRGHWGKEGVGQIESSIDIYTLLCVKLGFPGSLNGKASAYNAGEPGLIPGSERSPGVGNGNPLQYSCLENSMDQGAWQATVHGVAKGWT